MNGTALGWYSSACAYNVVAITLPTNPLMHQFVTTHNDIYHTYIGS